jgi:hypothetical protein
MIGIKRNVRKSVYVGTIKVLKGCWWYIVDEILGLDGLYELYGLLWCRCKDVKGISRDIIIAKGIKDVLKMCSRVRLLKRV